MTDTKKQQNNMQTFDGYTNYTVGTLEKMSPNFTITLVVTPFTYETVLSGLFSCFNRVGKEGLLIAIGKRGKVKVIFGTGKNVYSIENVNAKILYQKVNVITFSYWSDAGWCDLCINGVLAGRLQFPRHTEIIFPKTEYIFGKYVDGELFVKDTKRGYFHGSIHSFLFFNDYIPYQKVMESHQKILIPEKKICLYNEDAVAKDIYRPAFHLMPPGKWMNEPHAPFFYKGLYHIFYQSNPHAPVWDNLCWGHLVSRDMVMWEYAGIALNPDDENDNDIDPDGCWSGSACIDYSGNPVIFYTAGNNCKLPNQSVAKAVPSDTSDIKFEKWNKLGVAIEQNPGSGFLGEFRDPFVFRRGDKYFVLVGTGDKNNGGGNALVYETTDLKYFKELGFLTDYDYEKFSEVGHVWELPVLLPLRNEKGEHACDILLLCACQVENALVETYYYLGHFDESTGRFSKLHEEPRLIDLGHGTFTGPSGFVTPDGRSVLFTIAQGRRGPDEYKAGWAHNGGMPVELYLRKGELCVMPVKELSNYFPKECDKDSILLENRVLVSSPGDTLEIRLTDEKGGYKICYDRNICRFYAVDISTNKEVSIFRGTMDEVDIKDDSIEMDIIVDHSIIEIYLNNKKSMTLRKYSYEKGYIISAYGDGDICLTVKGR
ncbi:glycoside hydrolase family 32 protein [Butyrivibrio sp. MB2005]|uniref:glycoside hydrolase family 32 protein n=1 Tax=Butyrivibrio sp. MB2005 TaxID=1280678 RepID=UPI0006860D23|nr:glycoside hydrolase family 32 protein [Butyrivibrio sp. MB2005]